MALLGQITYVNLPADARQLLGVDVENSKVEEVPVDPALLAIQELILDAQQVSGGTLSTNTAPTDSNNESGWDVGQQGGYQEPVIQIPESVTSNASNTAVSSGGSITYNSDLWITEADTGWDLGGQSGYQEPVIVVSEEVLEIAAKIASIEPLVGNGTAALGTSVDAWPQDAKLGYQVEDFYDQIFGKVHLTPSHIDVGTITEDTSNSFSIWNTTKADITLATLLATNAEAISITSNDGLYAPIRSMETRYFDANVAMDGGPIIDATYVFDFGSVQCDLLITGQRLMAFAFAPDWQSAPTDIFEYKTSIFESYDGTEHRARLREEPRLHKQYQYTVDSAQRRALAAMMYTLQSKRISCPTWTNSATANKPSVGETVLAADTTNLGLVEGDSIYIWQNYKTFQVAVVTSISNTTISLKSPIDVDFTGPVTVSKMGVYTMQDSVTVNAITDDLSTLRPTITEDITSNSSVVSTLNADALISINGTYVFDFSADRSSSIQQTHNRTVDYFDTQVAGFKKIDKTQFPSVQQKLFCYLSGKDDIHRFRSFLHAVGGMHKPFFVSTKSTDLEPITDIAADQTTLQVFDVGYSQFMFPDGQRRHLEIKVGKQSHYVKVINAVKNNDGSETLTLDAPIGVHIENQDVERISFLEHVRFNTDKFEIKYLTQEIAETTITTRTVKYDL